MPAQQSASAIGVCETGLPHPLLRHRRRVCRDGSKEEAGAARRVLHSAASIAIETQRRNYHLSIKTLSENAASAARTFIFNSTHESTSSKPAPNERRRRARRLGRFAGCDGRC